MQLFNIYTFGDTPLMWSVMNGIAAYFNNGGIRASMITFGGLFAIAFYSYKVASHNITPGEIMGVLFGWMILLSAIAVPTSVVITDIYTGKVQKVDNVPLLISAPYSFISTGSWNVFQNFDTTFQPATGSYLTVTQNGIVSPIELLISMRNSDAANNIDPYLYVNLQGVVADCALGGTILRGPGTGPDSTLDTAINPISYLAANMRQTGITNWYDAANTSSTVITCASAGAKLQAGFQSLVAGSAIQKVFASSVKSKSPSSAPYQFSDYQNVHSSYISSISSFQQNATDSAITSLSASTIDYTIKCLGNAQNISSSQNCAYAGAAIASPLEQWKNESVQNASFFSRIMFSSMSIMQFLFLVLTPLVLMIIMLFPMHGIRIMMAYVMFGVWTNSWLIFAAPMNYYIQSQIVDALATTAGPWGGITIGNFQQVYSVLSLKLALASDVMASTPLISLAVLTGSMFSMNSLASKWSGEKHSDPSLVSGKSAVNAPISQGSPMQTYNPNSQLGISTGSAKRMHSALVSIGNSETTGNQWSHAETSNKGKTITLSDGTANKTTLTVADVEEFRKGQTSSEENSLKTTGLWLSEHQKNNSQFAAQIKELSKKTGRSEGDVANALNLAVNEKLAQDNPNHVKDLSGANGTKAQGEAKLKQAVAADENSRDVGKISTILAATPVLGKLPGELVGKYAPSFSHSNALAYGASRGLSTSITNAFEQSAAKLQASTDGHGSVFSVGKSGALQTVKSSGETRSVQMDEHALAISYNSPNNNSQRMALVDQYNKYANAKRGSAEQIAFDNVKNSVGYSGNELTRRALIATYTNDDLGVKPKGADFTLNEIQSDAKTHVEEANERIKGSNGNQGSKGGPPVLSPEQTRFKADTASGVLNNGKPLE